MAMRERPICLKRHEVQGILAGRKTQTRRVVKMPDGFYFYPDHAGSRNNPANWGGDDEHGTWWALADGDQVDRVLPCPYGQPGDRMWVRETHAIVPRTAYRCSEGVQQTLRPDDDHDAAIYREGWELSPPGRWRPSIHMPRWASRITLEVTGVRVERLNAISEEDAQAEGIEHVGGRYTFNGGLHESRTPTESFKALWGSINGHRSWDANPFVWVVEFKRITP